MLMYSFRYVEAATAYYASDLTRGGVNVFVRNAAVCRKNFLIWVFVPVTRMLRSASFAVKYHEYPL